ncbi:hypothetical protein IW262DRAFT_709052 [Armillaria fumosa]|nr:hypothetical protein IW262DRAFT_709052 [Armillaria fumosa]
MAMKRKFDDAGDATYKVRVLIPTSPIANSTSRMQNSSNAFLSPTANTTPTSQCLTQSLFIPLIICAPLLMPAQHPPTTLILLQRNLPPTQTLSFTPSLSQNPSTKILTLAQATRLNLTSVSYSLTATFHTTVRIAPKSRNYVSLALPESVDNVRCGVSANNAARFPWSTATEHQTILTTIPSFLITFLLSSPFLLLPCRSVLASPFSPLSPLPFAMLYIFIPFNSWRLSPVSLICRHPSTQ